MKKTKKWINWFGICGIAALSAACGGGTPGDAKAPPNPKTNLQNQQAGACTETFIGDYDTLNRSAHQLPTEDPQVLLNALLQLKADVTSFQQKYDGTVCSVVSGGKTLTIDVNAKCAALQATLDKYIAQLQGHVESSSSELILANELANSFALAL